MTVGMGSEGLTLPLTKPGKGIEKVHIPAGKGCPVTMVAGESGTGKTTLMRDIIIHSAGKGVRVLVLGFRNEYRDLPDTVLVVGVDGNAGFRRDMVKFWRDLVRHVSNHVGDVDAPVLVVVDEVWNWFEPVEEEKALSWMRGHLGAKHVGFVISTQSIIDFPVLFRESQLKILFRHRMHTRGAMGKGKGIQNRVANLVVVPKSYSEVLIIDERGRMRVARYVSSEWKE